MLLLLPPPDKNITDQIPVRPPRGEILATLETPNIGAAFRDIDQPMSACHCEGYGRSVSSDCNDLRVHRPLLRVLQRGLTTLRSTLILRI
jgi:hypothetical protein